MLNAEWREAMLGFALIQHSTFNIQHFYSFHLTLIN